MNEKNFVTQYVSGAYGPLDEVPWQNGLTSEPMTLNAARAEVARWKNEMHERCSGGWDSHMRIIACVDAVMETEVFCSGPNLTFCPQGNSAIVQYVWPAGETCPMTPEPDGWFEGMCPTCAAQDTYWVNNPYRR